MNTGLWPRRANSDGQPVAPGGSRAAAPRASRGCGSGPTAALFGRRPLRTTARRTAARSAIFR
eukprot:7681785-Alexandrium_andersonii.AAC.1